MVRSRFEFTLLAASAILLAGCAAGTGGGGAGGGAAVAGDAGGRPRETTSTNTAMFILVSAAEADDPAARYQEALTAALRAVGEGPNNPLAYLLAGRAHIGLGSYVAADSMLTRAEELYPAYLEETAVDRENAWITLFNESLDPLDAGDTEAGIRMLETAEVIYSAMRPEALMNLGITYGNAGRYDEAVDAYERTLEVVRGPRLEQVDSATAATWETREQLAAMNLATILDIAQRHDEAAAAYVEYLQLVPGDVSALTGLAKVVAPSDPDSARAIYDGLLGGGAPGPREYLDIGVGLYNMASAMDTTVTDPKPDYRRAAQAFKAIADMSPQNRDAVYNLAQSLFDAQEWEELVPASERLMELDPYNPQTYLLRAFALDRTGEQELGLAVYASSDSLEFTLTGSSLQSRSGGGGTLNAMLTNNTLEEGTQIVLRVHFNGEDGEEVGTVDVSLRAPRAERQILNDAGEVERVEAGGSVPVQATLQSEQFVMGYYIEVVSPR